METPHLDELLGKLEETPYNKDVLKEYEILKEELEHNEKLVELFIKRHKTRFEKRVENMKNKLWGIKPELVEGEYYFIRVGEDWSLEKYDKETNMFFKGSGNCTVLSDISEIREKDNHPEWD